MAQYGTDYYRLLAQIGPPRPGEQPTNADEVIKRVAATQQRLGELGSQSAGVVRPASAEAPLDSTAAPAAETAGPAAEYDEGTLAARSLMVPGITAERHQGGY